MKKVLTTFIMLFFIKTACCQSSSYVELQEGKTTFIPYLRVYFDSKDTTHAFTFSYFTATNKFEVHAISYLNYKIHFAKNLIMRVGIGYGGVLVDTYAAFLVKNGSGVYELFQGKTLVGAQSFVVRIIIQKPTGNIEGEYIIIRNSLSQIWYRGYLVKKLKQSGFELGIHHEKGSVSGVRISRGFLVGNKNIKINAMNGYKDFNNREFMTTASVSFNF